MTGTMTWLGLDVHARSTLSTTATPSCWRERNGVTWHVGVNIPQEVVGQPSH
jgi:hypothetical protein